MALHYVTARRGSKYGPEYSQALRRQIPGLVVLGEDRPFLSRYENWWCKLEVFAPWNADLRPCLWIDLDTFVFDLTPFDDIDDTVLWMLRDFNKPDTSESGIMLVPRFSEVWNPNLNIPAARPDAAYIRQFPHRYLQDSVSGIYSYKRHAKASRPDDAIVVCFHGRPRPHETDGWAGIHWNEQLRPPF